MQIEFITQNSEETKELGRRLSKEMQGGEVICLFGELGAGKTAFTQGILEALEAQKPYTSPTFVIMKEYQLRNREKINKVYHFDAYRIEASDLLSLGWQEILADKKNISIIEWANRVEEIMPKNAICIDFVWTGENERKLICTNLPKIKKHVKKN
jgi:tRNA threonylcarbamoyladenosine biosynthesis protein TsaE